MYIRIMTLLLFCFQPFDLYAKEWRGGPWQSIQDADVLLVLDYADEKATQNWTYLVEQMGLRIQLWDAKKGFFSFQHLASQGDHVPTIVLPESFSSNGQLKAELSSLQLDFATPPAKIHLYATGPAGVRGSNNYIIDKILHTGEIEYASESKFKSRFKDRYSNSENKNMIHKIAVNGSYGSGEFPAISDMLTVRDNIKDWLDSTSSDSNFSVNVNYSPKKTGGLLKTKYKLGDVVVTTHRNQSIRLVALPAKESTREEKFIFSIDNIRSLCMALPERNKAKTLSFVAHNDQFSSDAFAAVLSCVQLSLYQKWLDNKPLDLTEVYMEKIAQAYVENPERQVRILSAVSHLMAVASLFEVSDAIKKIINDKFLSKLGGEERAIIEDTLSELINPYSKAIEGGITPVQRKNIIDDFMAAVKKETLINGVN